MSKHLTETIPLKAVVFNESGVPVTTATIKVQVIRDSDGYYWTGSAWSVSKTDLTVAHVGAGVYVYSLDTSHASFLSPSSITCFFWSSNTELEDSIGINFDLDEDYEARINIDTIIKSLITTSGAVVADGSNTALTFKTNLATLWSDDYFNDMQIVFSSSGGAVNKGQVRRIVDYDDTTGFVTVDVAFDGVPVATDAFFILSRWVGLSEDEIAAAVWSEDVPASFTGSQAGKVLGDVLDDTTAIDGRLPSDPADQSQVEDAIDAAVDELDGADDRDHTEIFDAIAAIQNNTRLKTAVPKWMQKPDAGNEAYRWSANLYDNTGAPEDPDDSEILVRVLQDDGTPITATLYKENALTNPLNNATDQGNFPSGNGWRAMERLSVGQFDLFYKVTSIATEEHLNVEFGWMEDGVGPITFPVSTIVSDVKGDIEDIQAKVDAIHVKTDAGTPSPTIPTQITTHDTDIKALPRMEACPGLMYVPSGWTRIDIEGGISDTDTEIPVNIATNLLTTGLVKIENEYIIYDGITDSKLQVTQRGAYSTTPVAHANNVQVTQSVVYPIRLVIFDNAGNMKNADSDPTLEIEDWKGTQELAPTTMTAISTGIYGYDYFIDYGEVPENKLFKFSATVDSKTRELRHEVVVIDQPASSLELVQYLGGGLGDFVCDQDGWYDLDGIKTLWTDVMKGYVRDADTGAPLDDAYVTAYLYENGETKWNGRPPGQARTRVNGTWLMFLDAHEYTFVVEKDGFRIVGDGVQNRTVG